MSPRGPIVPNIAAEKALLGSLLIHGGAIERVASKVRSSDFLTAQHQRIFKAMLDLHQRGKPIDVVLLADKIDAGQLAALALETPTSVHIDSYAVAVAEQGRTTRMLTALKEAEALFSCPGISVEEIGNRALELIGLAGVAGSNGHHPPAPDSADGITLRELLHKDIPPARYAIDKLLPEGLTLLVGKSKMGKSWLALNILLAIAAGGYALGSIKVEPGDALYLALEDNERRLQKRTRALVWEDDGAVRKLDSDESVSLGLGTLTMHCQWPRVDQGGLEQLEEWIASHPNARIVAVDTLKKVRPRIPGNSQQSAYDRDYESLEGLQRIANQYHIAVIVVHHMRKMGAEDPVDSVNGSAGLPAAADGLWILERVRGDNDARLFIVHREDEEQDLGLSWNETLKSWTIDGTAEEHQTSKERKQILECLKAHGPLTPKDIAGLIGKIDATVRVTLRKMLKDQQVKQVARGEYAYCEPQRQSKEEPPAPIPFPGARDDDVPVFPLVPGWQEETDEDHRPF